MASAAAIDPRLIARMTGRMGDRRTIETTARILGESAGKDFAERLAATTGLDVEADELAVAIGTRAELATRFDTSAALCEAEIAGWSNAFLLGCDNDFVIACTENLLGGDNAARKGEARALSEIERDVAGMVLSALASAFAASLRTDAKAACGSVFAGPLQRESDHDDDAHVAELTMTVTMGAAHFTCRALLPQEALLKTKIAPAQTADTPASAPEWVEQLTQTVHTSNVRLEADIALAPLSLAATSRLKAGDILPFADEEDLRVLLKANGKNLFWCELGRAGNRYMLRLSERHGSERDFIRELSA